MVGAYLLTYLLTKDLHGQTGTDVAQARQDVTVSPAELLLLAIWIWYLANEEPVSGASRPCAAAARQQGASIRCV